MTDSKIATEQYILCGDKKLRCGFTTGSAATMATQASFLAILNGKFPEYSKITTPKGWIAVSEVLNGEIISKTSAKCSIKKDGGDDTDATNGIAISSEIAFSSEIANLEIEKFRIEITGGKGIGIVTKKGLDQAVGEYAINSVPRKMIKETVENILKENENSKFFSQFEKNSQILIKVTISAENGEEIAKNTFNPMLGIKGGISILGTSGVVEPMSEEALIESIFVEMKVAFESQTSEKKTIIVTPGNIGEDYLHENLEKIYPEMKDSPIVRCSNFIGKAIDFACELGFSKVLFVGHAGKFVKVAGGIMNTHSHNADCRMEIIASHATLTCFDNLDKSDIARIMNCVTVNAAFDILDETNSSEIVWKSIIRAAKKHIQRRSKGKFDFDFVMFK